MPVGVVGNLFGDDPAHHAAHEREVDCCRDTGCGQSVDQFTQHGQGDSMTLVAGLESRDRALKHQVVRRWPTHEVVDELHGDVDDTLHGSSGGTSRRRGRLGRRHSCQQ
ncbi:MAG TPA: hypothetical protein VH228_02050 [Nocardioides sp.]|nr:hypothetical protein [Nocardioides sp.]